MSDSNSVAVDQEKTAKNTSNKDKRKEPKAKRQRTDVNERVLTDPFRRLSTMKDMSILMVGLVGAGKSTILNKLDGKNVSNTIIPGYYIETLVYNNITLKAWDVSGEFKTHLQGSDNFKDTRGLIFVVDSTDRDRLDRARDELHRLLNEELLKDVVLLVFANKQDMPNQMNEAEITERLGLSTLRQCHRHIQNTCAITGAGLYEGLDWLSKYIKHTFDTSREVIRKGLLDWLRNSSANKSNTDSENASIAADVDVQEAYNRWFAHGAKVKLLEAAIREEKMKEDRCTRELGVAVYRLTKMVKKYDRDKHKEAEVIIRKRKRAERIARGYLKYRSKHTRD